MMVMAQALEGQDGRLRDTRQRNFLTQKELAAAERRSFHKHKQVGARRLKGKGVYGAQAGESPGSYAAVLGRPNGRAAIEGQLGGVEATPVVPGRRIRFVPARNPKSPGYYGGNRARGRTMRPCLWSILYMNFGEFIFHALQ
jgi:hypothetical protein